MNTFLFIAILLLIFYKISIFLLLCIPLRIFNKKNIHPNNISTKVKKRLHSQMKSILQPISPQKASSKN